MADDRSPPSVDLSHLSPQESKLALGELVELCLRRGGACVILRRKTGEITLLNPDVLDAVSDEDVASHLLSSWTEEEVLEYLRKRNQRKARR